MGKTADKNKTGQPGLAMKEVWNTNNIKFDDGIKEVVAKPGEKAPKRSPYYTKLLKKHGASNKTICIDCGKGIKTDPDSIKPKNPRCSQCLKRARNRRREELKKKKLRIKESCCENDHRQSTKTQK